MRNMEKVEMKVEMEMEVKVKVETKVEMEVGPTSSLENILASG